jgi:hypothetical protein
MIKAGEPCTKADLDEIAEAANLRFVPLDLDSSFQDTIGTRYTLTGPFSFEDPITSTHLAQWRDELNRIWNSMLAWFDDATDPFHTTPYDYASTYGDAIPTALSRYWGGVGGKTRAVASCGPGMQTHAPIQGYGISGAGAGLIARAFAGTKLYFSQLDYPPTFQVHEGMTFSGVYVPGDDLEHTDGASQATVGFEYSMAEDFYANLICEFEFYWNGSGSPSEPGPFCGFSGDIGAGSDTWWGFSADNQTLYVRPRIDINWNGFGVVAGSGTFSFLCYTSPGWKWRQTRIWGQFTSNQTDATKNASECRVATTPIIHPRNAAMRAALHVTTDIDLVEDDILDLEVLIELLADVTNAYPPATYIRSQLLIDLRDWIDAYPGGAHDADILAELVSQLNTRIIRAATNLNSTAYWNGVTKRPATLWLIEVDPEDGDMLARLNRLLLEDAFPQIRKIPDTIPTPENEVVELDLPETREGNSLVCTDLLSSFGGAYYTSGIATPGYMLNLAEAQTTAFRGIYVALAWPQRMRYTNIDHLLPQYAYGWGMIGQAGYLDPVTKNWPYVGVTPVQPAIGSCAAAWPTFHTSDFGDSIGYGYPALFGDAGEVEHADGFHVMDENYDSYVTPVYDGTNTGEQFVDLWAGPSNRPGIKFELTARNRNITILLGNAGPPDIADPGSYYLTKDNGTFTYPDDLTAAGINTDIAADGIWWAMFNLSATPQTIRIRWSTAMASGTEWPPLAEPYFFPRQGIPRNAYAMQETKSGDFTGPLARVFTPIHFNESVLPGKASLIPIPDNGYSIYEIIVSRPPTRNAAGIRLPNTTSDDVYFVEIGVMAGTGVINGAISGAFPGYFISLGDTAQIVLAEGQSSARAAIGTNYGETFIPVLEGCPLAWRITASSDGTTTDPGLIVTALVDHQPSVNVAWTGKREWIRVDKADGSPFDPWSYLNGRHAGAPHFPGTPSAYWSQPKEKRILTAMDHAKQYGSAGTDLREQTRSWPMPKISAEFVKDFQALVNSQPPL